MRRIVITGLTLVLGLAGCGDDDGADVREIGGSSGSESGSASGSEPGSASGIACEPVGDASTAESAVEVTLDEYSIAVEGEASAGAVTFEVVNAGAEPHELAVVAGDDADALPVEEGVVLLDELPERALIGEVEPFPAGETCEGTFELGAGDYLLICNVDAEEAHFGAGMVTVFTVGE